MKTLEAHELAEHIDEILRLINEDGETIEVTNGHEVVAHLVPTSRPKHLTKRGPSEAWKDLERLSAEISAHWPKGVSAVDAVRDVRRDL